MLNIIGGDAWSRRSVNSPSTFTIPGHLPPKKKIAFACCIYSVLLVLIQISMPNKISVRSRVQYVDGKLEVGWISIVSRGGPMKVEFWGMVGQRTITISECNPNVPLGQCRPPASAQECHKHCKPCLHHLLSQLGAEAHADSKMLDPCLDGI